jgi:Tfp pilus assembly protein PilW
MRGPYNSLGQAGFSPIETLIATLIGLVAVAAFTTFSTGEMYAMRNQASQTDLQSSARGIVDLFEREVRRAGTGTNASCTGTVSTGILVAKSSQIQIKADLSNPQNGTGDANENVTYTLDFANSAVKRTDNNTTTTADTLWSGVNISGASAIEGSQISYFDNAGNQLVTGSGGLSAADLLNVVRVKLVLTLKANVIQPGNSTVLTATAAADVDVRNRYFVMASQCAYN